MLSERLWRGDMTRKMGHILDDGPLFDRIRQAVEAGELPAGEHDLDIPAFLNRLRAEQAETRKELALEIQAHLAGDRLVLSAPPGSPLAVRDNRIVLEDGRELVIALKQPAPELA